MNNYYRRGGRVDYGIGGALLKLGSNLASGKGFGKGALKGVGKAAVTPGSGIGAGASLAGNLLQKSKNPLLQGIGKAAGVASNFMPGGGGIGGAIGALAGGGGQGGQGGGGFLQNAAGMLGGGQAGGGGAGGGLLNMAQGLLGAEQGAMIPAQLRGVKLMKRDSMGDGGMVYEDGGVVYAENGTQTPGGPPRYFQPQVSFDMDKSQMREDGDEYRFVSDPEQRLQQKVNLGLASKADRDDKKFTRDFNPIPVGDFYDDIAAYNRQMMRDSEVGKMVDAGDDILKIRGELVPYDAENYDTTSEDYEKRNQMLLSRDSGEDSDFFGSPDVEEYQYMVPQKRKGGVTGGILDQTGMGDRGFTRAELGSGQTPFDQRVGTYAEDVATRGLKNLVNKLNEDRARYAGLYERRYKGEAALPGGKQDIGGRSPIRLRKRY